MDAAPVSADVFDANSADGYFGVVSADSANDIDLSAGYALTATVRVKDTATAGKKTISIDADHLVFEAVDEETGNVESVAPAGMAKSAIITVNP